MKRNENEKLRRSFLLNGSPFLVILSVALPLLFQNSLTVVFSFFDVFTAANMNSNVVTTVAFASEIRNTLGAISGGLSVGAGIMISRTFGSGDMKRVQVEISTVFFTALFIAFAILLIFIPFSRPILRLASFPEELLSQGTFFLSIEILTLAFTFINSIFFTTEKARGRTKIVMYGNISVMVIKTLLNFGIIYLVSSGTLQPETAIYLLPLASGIAFASFSCIAIRHLFSKKNQFQVSFRKASFKKIPIVPLAKLSFPVIIEKVLIPFGKVICNALMIVFGSVGVAAYSCSLRILSLATSPLVAFKDAETTIISANLGNHNAKRAISFLFYNTFVTFFVGTILFIIVALSSELLISFFAKGNTELADSMRIIYRIARWAAIFDATDGAMCGFLYALRKTKLPTIVNVIRLFFVRIPVFLLLTRVYGFGIEAIAWSILAANGMDAFLSLIFAISAVRDLKCTSKIEKTNNEKLTLAISALGKWDSFDESVVGNDGIVVPEEILEAMCLKHKGTLSLHEMTTIYKEAVVEARIDELAREELQQEFR